jgi:signal peptidase
LALGTGYPLAVVEGRSMVPTYFEGDLLIIKGEQPEKIKAGDIIVFHSPYDWEKFIVHRVVAKQIEGDQIYFLTKGDNNPMPDAWKVPAKNIVGVAIPNIRIPVVGQLVLVMQSPIGILILGILIVLIIILEVVNIDKS